MVMLWRSKKNKDGGTSHFQPNETKRDVSDDDNPITFATPLVQDDELDSFAEQVKNDFNNESEDTGVLSKPEGSTDQSDYEFARQIMDEFDEIGESSISDEDKLIDFYNMYNSYEELLSDKQKSMVLSRMQGLDKQIKQRGKNSSVASNIQNSIQKMMYGNKSDVPRQQTSEKESRSENTKEKSKDKPEKESRSFDFGKNDDDDWNQRLAVLNALSES